jgi:sarcosine oxidase subunit gamma
MSAVLRTSPLADVQRTSAASWVTQGAMPVVQRYGASDSQRLLRAGVGDLSHRHRAGAKGPGARAWLEGLGLPTPAEPNQWCTSEDGSLIARLGMTEYLIEGLNSSASVERVRLAAPTAQVYPVPRFDAAMVLTGTHLFDFLKQTCSFDFEGLPFGAPAVVLTSMAGVGITAVLANAPNSAHGPHLRLWCDGTYAEYLWQTLVEVGTELGGGAVGHDALSALSI